MIVFQFDSEGESFLVVILEKVNIDRMAGADPTTLNPRSIGGLLAPVGNPANLHVLVAYEPDSDKLREVTDGAESDHERQVKLFKHVMRGYQYTQNDGPDAIMRQMLQDRARRSAKRN